MDLGSPRRGVAVRGENLIKVYRKGGLEVQALRGVTVGFEPGTITAVMGPSGSGKTTLLNLLGGVDRPTGGIVHHGDVRVDTMSDEELDRHRLLNVGFVFQTFNLIPTLTALENVELPMALVGVPRERRRERALELLDRVGLKARAEHRPGEMSGGEQQRLAIAIALANDPPIVLADEPTAELDYDNARAVVELLIELAHDYGKTVVVTTHDPRVAIRTDSIVRLEDGLLKGIYAPTQLEETMAPAAGRGGQETGLISISGLIRARIARIEEEIEEVEAALRRGEIGIEEAFDRYQRLRRVKDALEDLLASIGG